jgi:hypothetical protein
VYRASVEGRQSTDESFLDRDQPDRYGKYTHSHLHAYNGRIAYTDSYLFRTCRNGNSNTYFLHAHWNNHPHVFDTDRNGYPHVRDSWNCYSYLLHSHRHGDAHTHVFCPDRDGYTYAHLLHSYRHGDAHTNLYACRVRDAYGASNGRQTSHGEFV